MSWRPSSTPSTTLPVTHLPRKLLGALTSLMRPSPTPYGLHPLHTAFTLSIRPSPTPYGLHSLHTAFVHSIRPLSTTYGLQIFPAAPFVSLDVSTAALQRPTPLVASKSFLGYQRKATHLWWGTKSVSSRFWKKYIFNMKSIGYSGVQNMKYNLWWIIYCIFR